MRQVFLLARSILKILNASYDNNHKTVYCKPVSVTFLCATCSMIATEKKNQKKIVILFYDVFALRCHIKTLMTHKRYLNQNIEVL